MQLPGSAPCSPPHLSLLCFLLPRPLHPPDPGQRTEKTRGRPRSAAEEAGGGRREAGGGERGGGKKESELIGARRALPSPRRVPRPPGPGGGQGRKL
jgi:hypothetical protein